MINTIISVLLIEDDPSDARLIQEMLLEGNPGLFTLETTHTLAEGINRAVEAESDIILLDLSLSDSAGLDTLFRLHGEVPETPIIVLTGFDEITLFGIEAVKAGAQDYLVKQDVDAKLLRHAIRYAIERHQSEMRLRRSEEEYRSLIDDVFDTSMVAVIILDGDFTIVWCNLATEIYFGVVREEILGKDKRNLIDDVLKCVFADPDDYAARLLKAYDERSHTDRFECHVLPDGDREERWLEHWSQPIRDGIYNGGRIEQYTDITGRKLLESEEQKQRRFAQALSNITATLTSTLDLDEVLGRILDNLDQIVPHDSASITMIEGDHTWVVQQGQPGKSDAQELATTHHPQVEYQQHLDQMSETHQPILIAETTNPIHACFHAYMGAPILLQNQIIGFINLLNKKNHSFKEEGLERLTTFAELAATAIQNARLYSQSRELAAHEERQRIARDLHDSVSQTIFTCRTMLESAVRRFDTNPGRARELVEEVHQLVITALSEMRVLLLELRPETLTQVSLKQLFEQYLQPIPNRRRFALELAIDDVPALPGTVQIALYRITQEALNNIEKHAQADNVHVNVSHQDDDAIEMNICDDGKGFDVTNTPTTSMGMKIMHERAAEIGAILHVESSPDAGTCIRVNWKQ